MARSRVRRAFKPHMWSRFRGTSFHGNVVLNFTGFPRGEFAVYAHAYHQAGQALVSHFAGRRGYRDVDACPIVFLYRHALELYLKSIIYWGNSLLRLNGKPIRLNRRELFQTHNLGKLMAAVRPIIRLAGPLRSWPEKQLKCFEQLQRFVVELERIDPASYSFRYPIDRKGNASLPNHFCFNVGDFGEKADSWLRLLDGVATWAYEEFQSEAEARSLVG